MVENIQIYSFQVDYDNFKSFVPSELSSQENVSTRCKGKPLNWTRPLLIETDEDDVGLPEADISLVNIGSFVVSESLHSQFFNIYTDSCEFLPLSFGERKLYLVNVIRVIDCLNKTQSKFNEFGGVSEIVFDKEKVPPSGFFKIKEDNFSTIFCAGDVRDLIKNNELTGSDFEAFSVI
jgi:hypothetical protein